MCKNYISLKDGKNNEGKNFSESGTDNDNKQVIANKGGKRPPFVGNYLLFLITWKKYKVRYLKLNWLLVMHL